MKLKKCSDCKKEKSLSLFYSDKKSPDKKSYKCKECYHLYYLKNSKVNYRIEKIEINNGMKKCTKCKKEKPIDQFYKSKIHK